MQSRIITSSSGNTDASIANEVCGQIVRSLDLLPERLISRIITNPSGDGALQKNMRSLFDMGPRLFMNNIKYRNSINFKYFTNIFHS